MVTKHCEHCGGELPKGYRTHCDNPECQRARKQKTKKSMRNYMREVGASRRKPDKLRPPYNPNLCKYCRKPLGYTFNRMYHPACHRVLSDQVSI